MSGCGEGANPCDPCGSGWGNGGWNGGPIEAGPGLHISANSGAFIYVNGKLDPPNQEIELRATISGIEANVSWSTEPNIKSLLNSSTFTLTAQEFGERRQVAVTAITENGEARTVFISALSDPFATIGAPLGTPVATKEAEAILAEVEETKNRILELINSVGAAQSAAEALVQMELLQEAVVLAREAADEAVLLTDSARDDAILEAQRASNAATVALSYKNQIINLIQDFDGEGGNLAEILEQVGIATTAAIEAGQSALASAGSAQTASAKATEAEQSAVAATAAKVEAETARSQAQTAATNSASSSDSAAGSAAAAQASAGLAAQAEANADARAAAAFVDSQSAAASATAAQQSATAANNSKLSAETASATAVVKRNEAVAASESASASAAAAFSSSVLAAAVGSGSLISNSRFTQYPESYPGAAPTGWWGALDTNKQYRVAGVQGGYAVRFSLQSNEVGSLATGSPAGSLNADDWVVMEIDVTLNSGSFSGSGLLLQTTNEIGAELVNFATIRFTTDPSISGNVVGAGEVGKTYRFKKLVKVTPANTRRFNLYIMAGWNGFSNEPMAAKDITVHFASVRAATPGEISTGTVLPSLSASVSQLSGAIADIEGSAAFLETIVEAEGSNPAMMKMTVGKDGSGIGLIADRIALASIIDGIVRDALVIQNGEVYLQGRVRANRIETVSLSAVSANMGEVTAGVIRSPNGDARFDLNNAQIVFNNGVFMKVTGLGFGSNNQFIEWFGPSQSNLANCTEANGIQYLKVDGDAYFGGQLSAGIISNAVQTTTVQADNIVLGPFSSNGRPASTVSTAQTGGVLAQESGSWPVTSPPPDPYTNQRQSYTCQYVLERATSETGPWTLVATYNGSGTSFTQTINAGNTGGSEPIPLRRYRHVWSVGISATTSLTLSAGNGQFLRIRRTSLQNTTTGQPASGANSNTISIRYTEP